ncbi:MAG TPA: hypothetical protein VGM83_20250 [Devosiaceae bacterium]
MNQAKADDEQADALVADIGRRIVGDANYATRDWTAIALVIEVVQRKRMYGYIYLADGDWEAETPEDFAVIEKAIELRAVMAARERPWMRCLFQIKRFDMSLTIKFDGDDISDWVVAPVNHTMMVEKLRPR